MHLDSNSAIPRLFEKADNFAGPNVPASAISYRLNVVRKEGAALGMTPGSSSGSSSPAAKKNGATAKRAAPAIKKNGLKSKGRKRGKHLGDDARWVVYSAIRSPVLTLPAMTRTLLWTVTRRRAPWRPTMRHLPPLQRIQ